MLLVERFDLFLCMEKHKYVTWKTVTIAQSKESKFFLSGTVSPVSVLRLNLQPKMCIPRILQDMNDNFDDGLCLLIGPLLQQTL